MYSYTFNDSTGSTTVDSGKKTREDAFHDIKNFLEETHRGDHAPKCVADVKPRVRG